MCRAPTKTCFPDAPLRSGNRPKPQHWKSDESTEVEETSAEEDQDWDDDSDADWTIDSEGRSSLSGGSVCALVSSDGQASLRRSTSETDLLVSEEEVNQTFACWKEDLVGITGLCGPVVDELLLANVRDHGWDTGQYLSEVLVAVFEESERKTSEAYRKVFARARLALPCAAPRGVGDVCLVCRERVLGDAVGPCGHRLHSACLAEGLRVQVRGGRNRLRCPACPAHLGTPIPMEVAAGVLGSEDLLALMVSSERQPCGNGSLFRLCPNGTCRTRPSTANYSMQVSCGCSERHRFCVYCGELPHEPVPCAQMMELCKALEELHVELEELPLEQYRARDELPLVQQRARGRADDRVTLSADLETMDLPTTATPPPTLRAAELRRLWNDFEDLFGTRRPQLIRSAEIALPLLTSWDLLVVDKPAGARPRSDKSTEQVLAETTRPCPRCFVPIRRAGGCVHMTCGNPRCQHEFCWLCLHNWTSATHDASFCTGRAEASHSEVLASVERQIRSNWAQQAHDTRPAEDTYAEEVRQRFRVALTTRLESDAELLSAGDADVPLRWRRLLEFYDHCETRIRATAQVAFAGVVDSHRAQQELIELLSWVRDRWWLRLSPEDVDAHNESFMDPQAFLELPCPVRRRMRAERALARLEQQDQRQRRAGVQTAVAERFLSRFRPMGRDTEEEAMRLFCSIAEDSEVAQADAKRVGPASRALSLAHAAIRAWKGNHIFELVGALEPVHGDEAQSISRVAGEWVEATEQRSEVLRDLLDRPPDGRYDDGMTEAQAQAIELLDVARKTVFRLALDLCGGTRGKVCRRGSR